MIYKFRFGSPIQTEAVVANIPAKIVDFDNIASDAAQLCIYGDISVKDGFRFTAALTDADVVYGLGEANRGINKRGYRYTSFCNDDPDHTENKVSLYGAHNFLMVVGKTCYGLFFDYPSEITFDIGYTDYNTLRVSASESNLDVYLITDIDARDLVKQFRSIIGRSYIPPRWAFGFIQSRWGYIDETDIRRVAAGYRDNNLPLDAICMDIDYMTEYKDFTVNEARFPNLPAFVDEMKSQGIRLVPIIDAGVKIEKDYDIYEEGVKNNYFCKREDGTDFTVGVWPGKTHLPDMLNKDARHWFGMHYKTLTDAGIEGFWNDMNEPAIFFSEEGLNDAFERLEKLAKVKDHPKLDEYWQMCGAFDIKNSREDYRRFYHNMNGTRVRHDKVHNLYGYNMTRAASEAFDEIEPDKRLLLFSRSSYIGMHRYGGIWTGDNHSWWSHLLLNIQMMPSLNMCGFLYSGADLGGFGSDTTRDLLLRWLAFGIFTPLMRNHSALNTREQECYQFGDTEAFRNILSLRYRLLPYIYSEFMKAAKNDDLLFAPLAFEYPKDPEAREIEDQLMFGEGLMLTPVYRPNTTGRQVYLPEDMLFVRFTSAFDYTVTEMTAGHHRIPCELTDVAFFIRKSHILPLANACECTDQLNYDAFEMIGDICKGFSYEMYTDDGFTKKIDTEGHFMTIS